MDTSNSYNLSWKWWVHPGVNPNQIHIQYCMLMIITQPTLFKVKVILYQWDDPLEPQDIHPFHYYKKVWYLSCPSLPPTYFSTIGLSLKLHSFSSNLGKEKYGRGKGQFNCKCIDGWLVRVLQYDHMVHMQLCLIYTVVEIIIWSKS